MHGESLIEFKSLPFTPPSSTDWVFFYSKQAVLYFVEALKKMPILPRLATMGSGTAAALEGYGFEVDFRGSGRPEAVAEAFGQLAEGQRVLFPRAKQARRSVQRLLEAIIEVLDLPVYQNTIREQLELPVCQHLVFTSPLNVQAYFAKYALQRGQEVYAIGGTTAAALLEWGVEKMQVAKLAEEAALAALVLKRHS